MARKSAKKERVATIRCQQVGRACNICGTHFEDGVCDGGHIIGHNYTVPVTKK